MNLTLGMFLLLKFLSRDHHFHRTGNKMQTTLLLAVSRLVINVLRIYCTKHSPTPCLVLCVDFVLCCSLAEKRRQRFCCYIFIFMQMQIFYLYTRTKSLRGVFHFHAKYKGWNNFEPKRFLKVDVG